MGFQTPTMAHPSLDFSHLSPEERLQLVEDLRDSIAKEAPASIPLPASHAAELDRRLERHRTGGSTTRPWREALERIDGGLTGRGG